MRKQTQSKEKKQHLANPTNGSKPMDSKTKTKTQKKKKNKQTNQNPIYTSADLSSKAKTEIRNGKT